MTLDVPFSQYAIFTRGLTKTFGLIPALRGVELNLLQGEFLTLFGPNGAGKTTLIKILSSLIKPTTGTAWVAGFDIQKNDPKMRKEIGVISHVSFLYENLSAFENITFYARMHDLERPEERALNVIAKAGLKTRMHDRVGTFSRGMLQRISIARAMINEPSILFLDEPYTGLDLRASIQLKEQLESLHDGKRAIIMTTHDISRGLEVSDHVAILAKGRIALQEKAKDIKPTDFEKYYFEIVAKAK
tara:strand:+ start:3029 stop:3763 length:735 start_codon:yes stop_codon:yes gene_type:complete